MTASVMAYVDGQDFVFVTDGLDAGVSYEGVVEYKANNKFSWNTGFGALVANENGQVTFRASLWNLTKDNGSGIMRCYLVPNGKGKVPANAVDHEILEFRYTAPTV